MNRPVIESCPRLNLGLLSVPSRFTRANRFFLFLALMSILLFPNCGMLFRTRTQPIPVTSSLALSTVGVNG